MKQHPFDALAFFFGLVFVGIGLPMLLSESGFSVFKGRWTLPTFLVIAGLVILTTTRKRVAKDEVFNPEAATNSDLDSMNPY